MKWSDELKKLAGAIAIFAVFFWLPTDMPRFGAGVMEAFELARWYAREHVLLCLVMKYLGARANKVLAYGVASVSGSILAVCSCTVLPLFAGIWRMGAGLGPACAFLYSGPAINVMAIILTARILGVKLGIARAVGAILFSIIIGLLMHFIFRNEELEKAKLQAELPEPEIVRPLWQNSIFFATMIGILVFANFGAPNEFDFKLRDGRSLDAAIIKAPEDLAAAGAAYKLKILSGPGQGAELLVPAQEIESKTPVAGLWATFWMNKWILTSLFALAFCAVLIFFLHVAWWKIALAGVPVLALGLILPGDGLLVMIPFSVAVLGLSLVMATEKGETGEWLGATWSFAKQILPLLLFGVLVAGFLLGRPDHEGFIPSRYVEMLVGERPDTFLSIAGLGGGTFESFARMIWPLWTNLFASVFGVFMYFATLTEVPILQGLIGAGMGQGPALALLLAGPALSLPSMLVIHSIMGVKKTVVFVLLVVVMATASGMIYGAIIG